MTPTDPQPLDWSDLPGRLIVVSGPSGSGKTSIVRRLVGRPGAVARLSTSATTRAPRPGELDGRDYHFVSRPDFDAAVDRGEFLEWAEIFGQRYGTPAGPTHAAIADGTPLILEIDVQGGIQVRRRVPSAMLVFVNAPSFEVLEDRLRSRSTEDEAAIARRLGTARREIEMGRGYHHVIINEDLDQAVDDLAGLLGHHGWGG